MICGLWVVIAEVTRFAVYGEIFDFLAILLLSWGLYFDTAWSREQFERHQSGDRT